jgi:flagellar hook-basal body complex protein FliE
VRVEPLLPDQPAPASGDGDAGAFVRALDALAGTLAGASRAEDAFAYGHGTLEAAVYERAQADVALTVATSSASRIAQSVQSILNMQV